MSDYLRPEYTPLFTQVQDFIADQLNTDPQLSALGIEFLPEHRLDIEYEIKNNLGKQGTVGIVNTLKGIYGGHDGSTNAWEIEAEVDVLENPPVRRPQMKKMGLSAGTTADVLDWVQESLCAPSSPTYGKFCAVSQEMGEDRGIIVGKAVMRTFAIADISAVVSGEHHWVCPYALQSDLTALQEQVYDLSVDVHGDYIEDAEGNRIDADLSFTNPNWTGWRIDGSDEILKGTKDLASNLYMYPDPQGGDEYYQISFDSQTSTWTLWMFYWIDDSWGTERSATASGTIDDTTIEFTGWKTLVQESTNKTIATTDEIPTKVSQLQHDSGFITAAQVPTPDKIEDLSANVIYANRNVQYIEEVANWTDADYPNDPLNWDAENNWWIANTSPSFYMKLQYNNAGTWTLEIGEDIGGEWFIDSNSVQDSQDATQLTFSVSGAAYILTKGVQQVQTTGELALKSYVDGIVGDINSVLDAINGEVI